MGWDIGREINKYIYEYTAYNNISLSILYIYDDDVHEYNLDFPLQNMEYSPDYDGAVFSVCMRVSVGCTI